MKNNYMKSNSKYRIIQSIPGKASAYKAQVRVKFLFWSWWEDISHWQWSPSDCEQLIKQHKGEITNVLKTFE